MGLLRTVGDDISHACSFVAIIFKWHDLFNCQKMNYSCQNWMLFKYLTIVSPFVWSGQISVLHFYDSGHLNNCLMEFASFNIFDTLNKNSLKRCNFSSVVLCFVFLNHWRAPLLTRHVFCMCPIIHLVFLVWSEWSKIAFVECVLRASPDPWACSRFVWPHQFCLKSCKQNTQFRSQRP